MNSITTDIFAGTRFGFYHIALSNFLTSLSKPINKTPSCADRKGFDYKSIPRMFFQYQAICQTLTICQLALTAIKPTLTISSNLVFTAKLLPIFSSIILLKINQEKHPNLKRNYSRIHQLINPVCKTAFIASSVALIFFGKPVIGALSIAFIIIDFVHSKGFFDDKINTTVNGIAFTTILIGNFIERSWKANLISAIEPSIVIGMLVKKWISIQEPNFCTIIEDFKSDDTHLNTVINYTSLLCDTEIVETDKWLKDRTKEIFNNAFNAILDPILENTIGVSPDSFIHFFIQPQFLFHLIKNAQLPLPKALESNHMINPIATWIVKSICFDEFKTMSSALNDLDPQTKILDSFKSKISEDTEFQDELKSWFEKESVTLNENEEIEKKHLVYFLAKMGVFLVVKEPELLEKAE